MISDFYRLIPDRKLPLSVSARCSTCFSSLYRAQNQGLIPSSKRIETVFVKENGPLFGYRCLNKDCPTKEEFETLKCMMEHRDMSLMRMNIKLGDEMYLNKDGTPNFDAEGFEKYLDFNFGPFRNCDGSLNWDTVEDGVHWLKCSDCSAVYKTCLFATYSPSGLRYYYNNFELKPGKQFMGIQKYDPVMSMHVPIPNTWLLFISEIRIQGQVVFAI